MRIYLAYLCILFLLGLCQVAISFRDCGSTHAGSITANISACQGDICNVTRGENIFVDLKFDSKVNLTKLDMTLTASIYFHYNINISVLLLHEDACECCGINCPISADSMVNLVGVIQIPSSFPNDIEAEVVWKLVDQKSCIVTCLSYIVNLT